MEKKSTKKISGTKKTTTKKVQTKTTKKKVNNKKKTKKGFTLIELLAVIIIVGVLVIVAVPAITSYISESRKSSYITTTKYLISGARNIVNSGKLGTYDTSVTYYLPYDMIPTENGTKTPYGEIKEGYVVVTYNGKGYDYYWTGTDTSQEGIYLTYQNKLENTRILTGVKEITTDIAICGKENIVVFNKDGTIKERKVADDCINQGEVYNKEDNCQYKLVTQYGSFSETEDVKETCVKMDTNYVYTTLSRYTPTMYRCNDEASYIIISVTADTDKLNDDFYFKVYDNSDKTQLLLSLTKADFPKYSYYLPQVSNISTYVGVTRTFDNVRHGHGYYVEYTSDYETLMQNGYASYEYYCSATIPEEVTYPGPWLKKSSDIEKIHILERSLENIPLTSVCNNANPQGGLWLTSFTDCNGNNCDGNTYYADISITCEAQPK